MPFGPSLLRASLSTPDDQCDGGVAVVLAGVLGVAAGAAGATLRGVGAFSGVPLPAGSATALPRILVGSPAICVAKAVLAAL